jgi:probable DNA metabolism protein
MNVSLCKMLFLLTNPDSALEGHEDLFCLSDNDLTRGVSVLPRQYEEQDLAIITGLYSTTGMNRVPLPEAARRFYELSVNAFDAFVHAWMSELPIEAQMLKFGRRVAASADRQEAGRAATDRGDADTLAVLTASARVHHEVHRMYGFLRFFPDPKGAYTAFCGPDHFVLPSLGCHFTARFGETAWNIIDEKRGLRLFRLPGEQAKMRVSDGAFSKPGDDWNELWRHYHSTVNNESRKNPDLQRQFLPKRYWKYLSEM